MPLFEKKGDGYEDQIIRLNLPPGWAKAGGTPGDILIFSDGSGDRQLSVSFHSLAQQNPSPNELLRAALDIYRVRMEQEIKNLSGEDSFEETLVPDKDPVGAFRGTSSETGRMYAGRLKSVGRHTVVIYLESFVDSPQETAVLADQIFSGLEIK